jgi:hypothetical protein
MHEVASLKEYVACGHGLHEAAAFRENWPAAQRTQGWCVMIWLPAPSMLTATKTPPPLLPPASPKATLNHWWSAAEERAVHSAPSGEVMTRSPEPTATKRPDPKATLLHLLPATGGCDVQSLPLLDVITRSPRVSLLVSATKTPLPKAILSHLLFASAVCDVQARASIEVITLLEPPLLPATNKPLPKAMQENRTFSAGGVREYHHTPSLDVITRLGVRV